MGTYAFLLLILLFWVIPHVFFGFTLVSMPLLFFNALFVFLIFPLNGPLFYKIFLVAGGNMIGLLWEYFLAFLAANTCYYFGDGFGGLYFLVSPFLALVWIVSIWALGLSILASKTKNSKEAKIF